VAQWCYKSLQRKQTHANALAKKSRNVAEILVQVGAQFGSVLWQRAYWYDRLTLAHAALSAARLLSDWKSVSTFARNISWIYFYQGDYLRSSQWAEESLSATRMTEDQLLIAAAKRLLGTVEMRLRNYDRSERLLTEVIDTCSAYTTASIARALQNTAWATSNLSAGTLQKRRNGTSRPSRPGRTRSVKTLSGISITR
jgi:hypothetical protein